MSADPEQMPSGSSDPLASEEPLFDPDDTPLHGVRVPPPPPTQSAELPTGLPPTLPAPTATPDQAAQPAQPARYDQEVPMDVVAEHLLRPAEALPPRGALYRAQNPYTIAPPRGRSGIIQYRVQPGDTLEKIAARFGISPDTIIWNNDGIYVNRLLPGDTLTILPEDGVLHRTLQEETIQSIADKYKVSPFSIVDSEFNPLLRNASPTTLLPPGVTVMVVGGVSDKKPVYWNPGITIQGSGRSKTVSFGGGPGSCGAQPNAGGTGGLVVPLPPIYTVVRGFSAYHTGIDLAAPIGTTVFAADSGTVIFAGWSSWGYGNTVVLAHGNLLTLYGHMSRVSVSCGQVVSRGTPIGAVGNTGNSSGPHLHFEVRVGEVPQNPENYLRF
ncbi:MAG: peptidoglycan DD-metalloendopeptidase family protein [Chloroflexi bacterium]|nr:peptidoglycan DD-metalloendopeptidase family protein [Chloroflexota bacterium]